MSRPAKAPHSGIEGRRMLPEAGSGEVIARPGA